MKSKIGIVLTLLTLFELTFTSQVVLAANEITRLVPFQGRLHGGDNKIVADGVYDLAFNVYDTPTGGTAIWTETHPKVSVIHGYVNILLGGINPMVASNFSSQAPLYDESKNVVNFAQQKYLGISINGGAEMFPRSQLVPSFHAFTANHANHATNSDKLGNLPADNYATKSYNTAADAVINAKINSDISTLTATMNSKFNGNKAKDADLLDGKDYTWFLPKTGKSVDADKLDGLNSTSFLRSTAKAVDADKLDGHDTSYFAIASTTNSKISSLEGKFTGAKAKDADKLDGLNSSDFLRNTAKAVDADKLDGLNSTNFMRNTTANGYPGLTPGGSTSNWVRTTTNGLLPYQSGSASSLGTSSWNFKNIYGTNIYDGNTLLENKYLGKTAKSVDADKLDGLDNTFFRNASNLNAGTVAHARLPAATTSVRGATKKNQMSNDKNGYFWDKETGFMMQWGYASTASDTGVTIMFPTHFTNAHNVVTTIQSAAGWSGGQTNFVQSINNNAFVVNRNNDQKNTVFFYWQATGYRAP